ncbi:hypothetical protein [Acrocarpospora corrugata]|uniref:hypothetical protein n=1 Tax=Acrocarpospora corrugata TaxID=35763 RepID=UPI0012D2F122|nr:hypothetical protein [Acrocarpospora corrugata]
MFHVEPEPGSFLVGGVPAGRMDDQGTEPVAAVFLLAELPLAGLGSVSAGFRVTEKNDPLAEAGLSGVVGVNVDLFVPAFGDEPDPQFAGRGDDGIRWVERRVEYGSISTRRQ